MSATGKDTNSSTTPSFISALVVAGITVGAFTAVWLVLHGKKQLQKVFQPRVELAPESKRPTVLPSGIVAYWKTVFGTPDKDVIIANGLDAYLFVRYLKVFGLQMLLPYFLLTFIILIPVSAASPNAGESGLNKLSFGNVANTHQNRHIAHFLVSIVLMFWTLYLLWREYNHFVEVRQAWLTSTQHLTLARSRTVVITNVPKNSLSVGGVREMIEGVSAGRATEGTSGPRFSTTTGRTAVNGSSDGASDPEGMVRHVWLTRDCKDIDKVWQDRDKECARLEKGVAKVIKLANKNQKKGKTPEAQGKFDAEHAGGDKIDRYVLPKKRPTWKQGLLGLVGKKMDLETSPAYIADRNAEISEMRKGIDSLETGNTAFARFSSQHEAHAFARAICKAKKEYKMTEAGVEMVPEDVQWSNTSMNPYQRKVRTFISWALTIGLIIVWAIPVAFVGLVSNVDTLCQQASWLAWICTLPSPALGIIKGVLPPALLAILFMLLPIVLRLMVRMQGEVRRSEIELELFSRFWLFQVIHGFLIVTLASGLISALGDLGNTASSVPTLLSSKLPGASIFFLTFILTATFSGAAKSYARVVPFVKYLIGPLLAGATPRKAYMKEYKMDSLAWATTWPPVCLIVCITIVYSVIQPVITLLAWVAFMLLYAAYKYLMMWCADQPDSLETGGQFYIKALRTVFVALYLEGICLAGLFFLSQDQNGNQAKSGLACGALMVVMIVIVAAFQFYIDWFRFKKDFLLYVHSTTNHSASLPIEANIGKAQAAPEEEFNAAGPEHGNTSGFHYRAFDHPALWKKQPVIWIVNDPLAIGTQEAERINAKGVEASTEYTYWTEKGRVGIERGPPDEAWYGGFSAQ